MTEQVSFIDKIQKIWEEDSVIDKTDLTASQIDTAKLHAKYFRYMNSIQLQLNKAMSNRDVLLKLKTDWLKGFLDKETMDKYGWKPMRRTVLNTEIPSILNSDEDIIDLTLKIQEMQQAIKYLESIIKMINNRGYAIRNILDYEKFINGGY